MDPSSFPSFMHVASVTPYGWEPKSLAALQGSDIENFTKDFDRDFNRLVARRNGITNIKSLEAQFRTARNMHRLAQSLFAHNSMTGGPSPLSMKITTIVNTLKQEDDLLLGMLSEKIQPLFSRDEIDSIETGSSLLHLAAVKGDRRFIQTLLHAGFFVDTRDTLGRTPFMIACSKNDVEIASILASAGANINAQALDGQTALHLTLDNIPYALTAELSNAIQNTIALLAKLKASCTISDARNTSPLQKAFLANAAPHLIFNMLAEKATPLTFTNKTFNPLMEALERRKGSDAAAWDTVILRLLDLNVNPNKGKSGMLPLPLAMDCAARQVMVKLIEKGAILDKSLFYDKYPHFIGVCIEGLQARGGDFSNIDGLGNSLLHYAVEINDPDGVMQILRQNFATREFVNQQNEQGKTALALAVFQAPKFLPDDQAAARNVIIDMLIQAGARLDSIDKEDNTILHLAGRAGDFPCIEKILQETFVTPEFVNHQNIRGETALALADSDETVNDLPLEIFLQKGARLDCIDKAGNTLLHVASRHLESFLVEKILSQNFATPEFVNHQNDKGETAICRAAASRMAHDSVFEKLIAKGARLDIVDKALNTLFHHTVRGGSAFLMKRILEQKFVTKEFANLRNLKGMTALQLVGACAHFWCTLDIAARRKEITQLLIQKGATLDVEMEEKMSGIPDLSLSPPRNARKRNEIDSDESLALPAPVIPNSGFSLTDRFLNLNIGPQKRIKLAPQEEKSV